MEPSAISILVYEEEVNVALPIMLWLIITSLTSAFVVSLIFLDFDLYKPTKIALKNFLPRMPKGSIIAFDELDNPLWPGETQAMLEECGAKNLKIQRLEFDPYIGFAVIGE